MSTSTGVVFPIQDGQRRTTGTARGVLADALRPVDPIGAGSAAAETQWRARYPKHFRRVVEASLLSDDAALTIARAGLDSVRQRLRWRSPADPGGEDEPLSAGLDEAPRPALETEYVRGSGEPEPGLSLPYRGERLTGDAIRRRLEAWAVSGIIEPSVGDAIGRVIDHPEWLRLPGRTAVLIGAAAEMSPLRCLLRWGADVAAVDLAGQARWEAILADAHRFAGSLRFPASGDAPDLARRAGADVLHNLRGVADWAGSLDGSLVLGGYAYSDGADHVRLVVATHLLDQELYQARSDTAWAALGTPSDVYAVPPEAVAASVSAYEASRARRLVGAPVRMLSGGRMLSRSYERTDVPAPGVNDGIVPQQGPNYLLAKRIQRWQATADRARGRTVSFHVAPPTRTRSVLRNRLFAAAYAGAGRFGVEVFEPATSATLMAALLVHDLYAEIPAGTPGGPGRHPWQDEAFAALHGGLWRMPFEPRSVLGIAAVSGLTTRG